MSKRIKDTDYAFVSAYLHAAENQLVSRERIERMIDAPSAAEAMRLLEECGYGDMNGVGASELENRLALRRAKAAAEVASLTPVPETANVFRIKYDYHNAKAIVKAQPTGTDVTAILSTSGRYAPDALKEAYEKGEGAVPDGIINAMKASAEVLAKTSDPQLADFVLDRAYFEELGAEAKSSGSKFLMGYAAILADSANIRAAVRIRRMGKSETLLREALVPGGTVLPESIIAAVSAGEGIAKLYSGEIQAAAVLGDENAGLTEFERACDNAVTAYMASAKSKPFGEEVPVGYLFAVESEISAVRTVITGHIAGLSPEHIRERLRDLYV